MSHITYDSTVLLYRWPFRSVWSYNPAFLRRSSPSENTDAYISVAMSSLKTSLFPLMHVAMKMRLKALC